MDIVDTDVLIDIQRGHAPALKWFASLVELPVVPGFVCLELIQDARNAGEVRSALKLVSPFQVIWPTESDCDRALSDFSVYHLSQGLGLIDAMIAACALGRSATLFTFNLKHYSSIPGLKLARPYER